MKTAWKMPERLCEIAQVQPGFGSRIALSDGVRQLTYSELDGCINAARNAFADMGLVEGDRVALLLPTSIAFVISYFGAVRAGLVVLPLNPLLGPAEIGFILSTMRPRAVVADTAGAPFPVMAALDGIIAGIDATILLVPYDGENGFRGLMESARTSEPCIVRGADEEALILFTSGTSGRPKGASHREAGLLANTRYSNRAFRITSDDVLVCPLPLSHVFGQTVLMLGALMAGAELALVPRPTPDAIIETMKKRGATFIAAVPTAFVALTQWGREHPGEAAAAARRLRFAFTGGAPLSAVAGEAFSATFGIPVHKGYGMTEVACCITLEGAGEPPAGGVGKICDPIEYRIARLADGSEEGELEIRGPNMMGGYHIDGVFHPRSPDEWFATGDIARRDVHGDVFILDRKKELIIRNGYNVYPSEVEATLAGHPSVALAAVIGVEDPAVGQEVAAFVSLRDGLSATEAELAEWCRKRIALYKYPRLVAILPALPTNPTGKISKRDLDPGLLQRVDNR